MRIEPASSNGRSTSDDDRRATEETVEAHLYDFPVYYDLIFGSDWRAEFDFLKACFEKYAPRIVQQVFEPACGTGRLLIKLARAGYDVSGNDLNAKAVAFCNDRLERHGFRPTAFVGDMADFRLQRKVDAAFNMINTFRHLPSEETAESHLHCVAGALHRGGVYVLGLHLTPTEGERDEREEWSARRGNLAVLSRMWSERLDMKRRNERLGMTFDIYTPTRRFRIAETLNYRTYTVRQMRALLSRVPEFEVAATYDFAYDIQAPIEIGPATEDVVFVLRKQ